MTSDQGRPGKSVFRVLATVGWFEPGFRGGGPVKSVARIVDTAPEGIDVSLITRDRDCPPSDPYPGLSGRWITRGRARVFYLSMSRPRQWLRLLLDLRSQPFDLLYLNSLWEPTFTIIPIVAARLRLVKVTNVLIAPRGELSPGALNMKARKKRSVLKVWRPLLMSQDIDWHASSDRESLDIRAIFPDARVVVNHQAASLYEETIPIEPEHEGPSRLVFISRISPMKNLVLALEALGQLQSPIQFDIYGPIEDAVYWARCKSMIDRLPSNVKVNYLGELTPDRVRNVFSKYDAFVFPTLGENFGHVIAESLSASCPVICSDKTPWTEILKAGGGMVVEDLTSAGLAKHLSRHAMMSPSERVNAKRSAADAYRTWRNQQASQNIFDEVREVLARQ